MFELRGYQKEAIKAVGSAINQGYRSVCLQMATGAGKTVCAGAMAVAALNDLSGKNKKILYLVHRKELLEQTYKTLVQFGIEGHLGVISPQWGLTIWKPIQIISIQTLSQRLNKMGWLDPALIFVDEAHHARAATWERVLKAYPQSNIIGMTATPARLDGKGLGELFDCLIEGPPMQRLIDEGSLCDIDIYSLKSGIDMKGIKKTAGDYNKKDLDNRVSGPVIASTIKNWLKMARNRRTLHYSVSIRHSKAIVEELKGLGISAEHVDGSTHMAERDAIFKRFSNGITQFVSNVDIVTEGFDCPECDCVIIKPTASLTLYLQMIGRVMRPKADGRKGLVLDVGGNLTYGEHGDPREPIEWSLEGGIEINPERAVKKMTRACEHCGFVYPYSQPECPACGLAPKARTPVEIDADLEMVAKDDKRAANKIRRGLTQDIMNSMGEISELESIARKFGYDMNVIGKWQRQYQLYWDARRLAG